MAACVKRNGILLYTKSVMSNGRDTKVVRRSEIFTIALLEKSEHGSDRRNSG